MMMRESVASFGTEMRCTTQLTSANQQMPPRRSGDKTALNLRVQRWQRNPPRQAIGAADSS